MTTPTHTQYTTGYRWYVLFVLTLGYIFNFIDRQVMTILLEPIKAEFGATDTQMGLLTGLAFALFYATLGVPMARLADRWSRRNVLVISMAVWSGMTALCGLAGSFIQLLACRIGVAVGEAGGSPPSHSMLADYYPPERRATALGIYALGIPFGVLFGFFVGGWMEEFFGWRWAFVVVGIPGLLLALLVRFTVKEPPRGMSEAIQPAVDAPPAVQPPVKEVIAYLLARRSFIHMAIGGGVTAFVGYGLINKTEGFVVNRPIRLTL